MKKKIVLLISGFSILSVGCNLSKVEEYKEQPQPMSLMEKYSRTGGQPGQISLKGDFLDANNKLNPSITVIQNAGNNVDGGSPEVEKKRLDISMIGTDLLEKNLKSKKRVLVFGCPVAIAATYIPKLSELENKQDTILHDEEVLKFDDREMNVSAWADTILICGASMLFPKLDSRWPTSVYLYAKKVILYGADLKFDPSENNQFRIETAELILIGDSHISNTLSTVNYRGPDFFVEAFHNTFNIGITANKITGDGHLEIKTTGVSKK